MKAELLKGKIGTLSMIPYIGNLPAVATSSTVTITDPGGTVLMNEGTASVNATTGEITYDFTAALNVNLGENFTGYRKQARTADARAV